MIKVLFVCLGNICRSPMAEFVFKDMVNKKGLSNEFYIESSATSMEEYGNPPHRGTVRKLNEEGIPVTEDGQVRKYGPEDIQFMDLAKFVGAAQAFKNYAPNVKINVIYCDSSEYEQTIRAYREQYGHLPHVFHPSLKIVDMINENDKRKIG